MEQTRVVDENATDLAPYGLKEPRIKVAFKAEGDVSGEVFIGDTTPMQGDIYAIEAGQQQGVPGLVVHRDHLQQADRSTCATSGW